MSGLRKSNSVSHKATTLSRSASGNLPKVKKELARSSSNGLITRILYQVVKMKLSNGKETKKYVKNIEGKIAKLSNKKDQDTKFDPFDLTIISDLLNNPESQYKEVFRVTWEEIEFFH